MKTTVKNSANVVNEIKKVYEQSGYKNRGYRCQILRGIEIILL